MLHVISANDASFQKEVISSSTPVLVDFWAEWCGPCRMLAPVLEEVAQELKGTVKVVKVNVEESPEAATQYGITSIPSLMLIENGQLVDSMTGFKPKSALVDWVKGALQK